VREWLERFIFFRDDVQLQGWPAGWRLAGLYGPEAQRALSGSFPALQGLSNHEVALSERAYLWPTDLPVKGVRMLLQEDRYRHLLTERKPTLSSNACQEAYQVARIEAGLPEPGHEIQEEYLPLEVGLDDAVSFEKGCYTGQEIIARMHSRGRLARELVGLRLEGASEIGSVIRQDGREIGRLTSLAHSPARGWIGLAVVKTGAKEKEQGRVHLGDGQVVGRLIALPFSAEPS
jgi:aminomethyltransferase